MRTFLLIGFTGGVAGRLASRHFESLAAVLVGGVALLAVAAYVVAARRAAGGDAVDGTTETAALAVLAAALLAGLGEIGLASGATAAMVLVLREKDVIRRTITRIDAVELRAGAQFAVLALVLLPILPSGPFGPWGGVRPRALWGVVLLLSGLNFIGFVARRAVGEGRGYVLTGTLGGLVSSTAVALGFARLSREPTPPAGLGEGVLGACTLLIPRVWLVAAVLSPPLGAALWPYLLPPLLVGGGFLLAALRRMEPAPVRDGFGTDSPLQLGASLRMALLFQVVLYLVAVVRGWAGDAGMLASSAVVGLTDMDALTVAMGGIARAEGVAGLAAQGIGVGLVANTAFKLGFVSVTGRGAYRRLAAAGLAALLLASALGLVAGIALA